MTFNNMVTTKADFDENWLIPANKSWMARFLNWKHDFIV